jgi:ketosteroid isomerase-like protein
MLSGGPAAAAQTQPAAPCAAPENRQFDFWVGDWDVYDFGGMKQVAQIRVDRLLGGCVVREQYEDTTGKMGQSLSAYDAARKVWQQSWVTNRGDVLVIEGRFAGGKMVLTGASRGPAGRRTLVRGTWMPINLGVRETAVRSTDGGKTWKPWFDLVFRQRHPNTSGDEAEVIALDTEYQAAVKRNDAATMDRILADDFILVVGTGKVYTKADLLEDARSGRSVYEHQEDNEQTARVWGDTVVVTAKLWEKGTQSGKPFDATLWFSDTYVRTPTGWRYVFGQASRPLAKP